MSSLFVATIIRQLESNLRLDNIVCTIDSENTNKPSDIVTSCMLMCCSSFHYFLFSLLPLFTTSSFHYFLFSHVLPRLHSFYQSF